VLKHIKAIKYFRKEVLIKALTLIPTEALLMMMTMMGWEVAMGVLN
jgi:hypothetical protein